MNSSNCKWAQLEHICIILKALTEKTKSLSNQKFDRTSIFDTTLKVV